MPATHFIGADVRRTRANLNLSRPQMALRLDITTDTIRYAETNPQSALSMPMSAALSVAIKAARKGLVKYKPCHTCGEPSAIPGKRLHCDDCRKAGRQRCTHCGEVQETSDFPTGKTTCKGCRAERTKRWRKENPERKQAATRAWDRAHPERRREYALTENSKAAKRAWKAANPEKVRAGRRKTAARRRERLKAERLAAAGSTASEVN